MFDLRAIDGRLVAIARRMAADLGAVDEMDEEALRAANKKFSDLLRSKAA